MPFLITLIYLVSTFCIGILLFNAKGNAVVFFSIAVVVLVIFVGFCAIYVPTVILGELAAGCAFLIGILAMISGVVMANFNHTKNLLMDEINKLRGTE